MGSFRGGLALILLPGTAWAEVCETVRPGWDGVRVTMVGEALALFSSPIALFLLGATLVAFIARSQWAGMAMTLGWTALVSYLVFFDTGPTTQMAMAEGCVGQPTLFIAAAIAICVATTLYTLPAKQD